MIQDAAYESLLKSRRQALHRRAADALRDVNAEPEAIAHHFTEADLDYLAIEWWGKAGDQALRRSAFQEAIAHLGKAIAMADGAGIPGRRAAGGPVAPTQHLTQLHVAYGNALIAARGYSAPETAEAFARARESASGDEDAPGRLAADYGLWASSYMRGDLPSMRAHVEAFLGDVEARPDSPEASVAHRAAGMTCWFAGEYREARGHLERALALFEPGRDDDLTFRFAWDAGVAAMASLAIASWALGEVDRAISLIDRMQTRVACLKHVGTLALGRMHAAMFELMRGDHLRAAQNAFELARLAREHDLNLWRAFGVFLQGWAASQGGAHADGLEDMRRGAELLREQNALLYDGLLKVVLAEAEARAGDPGRAIAIIDEALATSDRTGYRAFEAELRRARGEMLLERDPAALAPAEEAFLTAIAFAKQQGTRSFGLRAAVPLAKLYQSTARPTEAYAALASALDGFAPTPEMPEIAEAQALLVTLAQSDDVKAATEQHRRRLDLQTSYGQALLWARGFTAEETKAAFARVDEIVGPAKDLATRIAICDAQCLRGFMRGEYREAREIAETLLQEAGADARGPEAGTVRRMLGLVRLYQGNLKEAQAILEREATEFQLDPAGHVTAAAFLALTEWHLGDVERARQNIERAIQRADETADAASIGTALFFRTVLESRRDDVSATRLAADALLGLSEQYGMKTYSDQGKVYANWARGRLLDADFGVNELEQALTAYTAEGNRADVPSLYGLLAELEASELGPERSLPSIDRGLAIADETGEHFTDPYLHRLRGELLLKRNPSEPAPVEEAFKAAIAAAKVQGARSYELLASLSLAKLYQSTGRPADAHAVLAPALEGFSPTTEMPEIAEAQALLTALAATDEVKAEAAHRQRLTQLHVSYGNALIATRGYGAPETTEAFARARESTAGDKDAPGRLSADYGLWVGSFTRGELPSMRAHSADFLSDVQARPDSPEAGVAHRVAGATCWFAGEYREAKDHLERALAMFQPGRDDDLAFRFGQDQGISAMAYLALVLWPLGEIDHAASFMSQMLARIASLTHGNTIGLGHMFAAQFALMHGGPMRGNASSLELARIASAHGLPQFRAFGMFFNGWARVESDLLGGLEGMRAGVDSLRAQNIMIFDGLVKIALAKAEAEAGDPVRAVAILDDALATADRLGHRTFEPELHRARGDFLLRRDPANSAPAQEAFLTAIAVSRTQGTRSFELRAALALAKLYQSTGHPAEALGVLSPALEGFAPTLEFPEIGEGISFMAAIEARPHL